MTLPYNGNTISFAGSDSLAVAFTAGARPVHRLEFLLRFSVAPTSAPTFRIWNQAGTVLATATPEQPIFSVTTGYYWLTAALSTPLQLTEGTIYFCGVERHGGTIVFPLLDGGDVFNIDGDGVSTLNTAGEALFFRVVHSIGGVFAASSIDFLSVDYLPIPGRKR